MKSVTILGSTGSVGASTVDLLLQAPERYRVAVLVGGRNVAKLAEQAIVAPRRPCGDRRGGRAGRSAGAAGRHRHPRLGRPRGGVRGGRRAGRLDHGGDHRRRRAGADPGRDPAGRRRGARQQGGAGLRRRRHAARGGRGGRHAAAGRFRAQRDLPGDGRQAGERGRAHRADRVGRPVPHRIRGRDGARHPGGGAAPPGLVDGRQDLDRLRQHVQQGARGDRGGPAVRAARGRASTCWCTRNRWCTAWCTTPTAACWRSWGRPTCGSRSRTRWPGRDGCRPARRGWTWPASASSPSRRRTRSASPHSAWPAPRLRAGGAAPAILSAANEVAVEAFLDRRIGFLDIARLVEAVLDQAGPTIRRHAGCRATLGR